MSSNHCLMLQNDLYSTIYIFLALIAGIFCGDLAVHLVGLICLVMLSFKPILGICKLHTPLHKCLELLAWSCSSDTHSSLYPGNPLVHYISDPRYPGPVQPSNVPVQTVHTQAPYVQQYPIGQVKYWLRTIIRVWVKYMVEGWDQLRRYMVEGWDQLRRCLAHMMSRRVVSDGVN